MKTKSRGSYLRLFYFKQRIYIFQRLFHAPVVNNIIHFHLLSSIQLFVQACDICQ
jgi:hypothetical protein